jgi:hypothetical protein
MDWQYLSDRVNLVPETVKEAGMLFRLAEVFKDQTITVRFGYDVVNVTNQDTIPVLEMHPTDETCL